MGTGHIKMPQSTLFLPRLSCFSWKATTQIARIFWLIFSIHTILILTIFCEFSYCFNGGYGGENFWRSLICHFCWHHPLSTELWCILYISWDPVRKAINEVPVMLCMCRKENVERPHVCWGIYFQSSFNFPWCKNQGSQEAASHWGSARLFSHCLSTTLSHVNHTPVHLYICVFASPSSLITFLWLRLSMARTDSFPWESPVC